MTTDSRQVTECAPDEGHAEAGAVRAVPWRRMPVLEPLPAVLDVPTAGRLLGLGRSAAYELVAAGQWPTPVLRLGRRWRVPTAPLLALLGLDATADDGCALAAPGERMEPSSTAPDDLVVSQGDRP